MNSGALTRSQGRWQLTLAELVLGSWVTGLMMLASRSLCPPAMFWPGLVFGFLLGAIFTAALLHYAHEGNPAWVRLVSALRFIFLIAGAAALVGAVVAYHMEDRNRPVVDPEEVYAAWSWNSSWRLAIWGLLCFPAAALCHVTGLVMVTPTETDHAEEETLRRLSEAKEAARGRGGDGVIR